MWLGLAGLVTTAGAGAAAATGCASMHGWVMSLQAAWVASSEIKAPSMVGCGMKGFSQPGVLYPCYARCASCMGGIQCHPCMDAVTDHA